MKPLLKMGHLSKESISFQEEHIPFRDDPFREEKQNCDRAILFQRVSFPHNSHASL